jgi:hypothetical protein
VLRRTPVWVDSIRAGALWHLRQPYLVNAITARGGVRGRYCKLGGKRPLLWKGMLSNAIVFNCNDLMPESAAGKIQIEYHVGPAGVVEFLKVWGATIRGHWDLVCSCWAHSGSSIQSGLQVANGHKAGASGGMLDSIMQHQDLFRAEAAPGADCMIRVSPRLTANGFQHSRCWASCMIA